MPQDIGPDLHLLRPRSHVGFVTSRGNGRKRMITRPQTTATPGSRDNKTEEQGEYHIELLEYEWPDLPPIIDMKDAVTRRRVSQGINYLLPVDKGRNSIDNKFRTDLRAMFQEPYAGEGKSYDETRVVQSAKVHFRTNTADTKWSREHIKAIPVLLNSESEKVRRMYAHSAPAGGRSKSGDDPDKVRQRSSLFLPIKAKAHPESQKLRQEVENIIKSVQEDNDDYDPDKENESSRKESTVAADSVKWDQRRSLVAFRQRSSQDAEEINKFNSRITKLTAEDFNTYEQLKNTKPPKPVIPEQFASKHLSAERNQEIWDWLHYGETITDFQYFLSVCG